MNLGQLERNLKNKDLSVFKTDPMRLIAKQIVQYQNFKFCAAKKKINRINLTEGSLRNYFVNGKKYIKTGIKCPSVAKGLFENIDFWLNQKLQPLTPSEEDKALECSKRNKKKEAFVQNEKEPKHAEDVSETNEAKEISFLKRIIELQEKEIALKNEYLELYKKGLKYE